VNWNRRALGVNLKRDGPERRRIRHDGIYEIAQFAPPAVKGPAADVRDGHSPPLLDGRLHEVRRSGVYRTSVRPKPATERLQRAFLGAPQQGQYPIPPGGRRSRHQLPFLIGEVIGQKSRAARLDGFEIAPHLGAGRRDHAQSGAAAVAERKRYRPRPVVEKYFWRA
jgi:hypothetical protein